jgi:hypothetical protein
MANALGLSHAGTTSALTMIVNTTQTINTTEQPAHLQIFLLGIASHMEREGKLPRAAWRIASLPLPDAARELRF